MEQGGRGSSYKIRLGLFLGCLLLLVAVAGLIGCGIRTENTYYFTAQKNDTSGDIIFIKGLQTSAIVLSLTNRLFIHGERHDDGRGAGHETFWFDVTGRTPHAMSCAPTGTEYVALSGPAGRRHRLIRQGCHPANMHPAAPAPGLEKTELVFSPGIKSFDWSSDATRIVYCTTPEVRTIKLGARGILW